MYGVRHLISFSLASTTVQSKFRSYPNETRNSFLFYGKFLPLMVTKVPPEFTPSTGLTSVTTTSYLKLLAFFYKTGAFP